MWCSFKVSSRQRPSFVNSTPRRRRDSSPDEALLPLRPTNIVLSPLLSVEDETDDCVQHAFVSSSKTDFQTKLKLSFISWLNAVSSFFSSFYMSTIKFFGPRRSKEDAILNKLDQLLNNVAELNAKHDRLAETQELLVCRVAAVEAKLALGPLPRAAGGPPPPPPPPPPPFMLLGAGETPQPLVIIRKSQDSAPLASRKSSRPSITLEDILNVQLKKTPAVKPVRNLFLINT